MTIQPKNEWQTLKNVSSTPTVNRTERLKTNLIRKNINLKIVKQTSGNDSDILNE